MVNWGATFWSAYSAQDIPPDSDQTEIALACPNCGIHTNAEIIGRFITEQNKYIRVPNYEMKIYNYFLQCTRCKSAILVLWSFGNMFNSKTTSGKIIFPIYTDISEYEDLKGIVPEAILEDIYQAEFSFMGRAYLGAGLLLRRACQYICLDKECKKDNLVNQIGELVAKGIITKDLSELAHNIRIVGNEIAHPDPNTPFIITRDDIKACSEFLKQLIQVIYVNPYKSSLLREGLEKRGVK